MLARDIEKVLKRATSKRRPSGTRAPAIRRLLEVFRERLTAIEHIDFFGSAGRDLVTTLFARLEEHTSGRDVRATATKSLGATDAERYQGRLWVTRPAPVSIAWHRLGSSEGSSILKRDLDSPRIGMPFRKMDCHSTCSASSSVIRGNAARSKRCALSSRSRNPRLLGLPRSSMTLI
jgi:hypothetical protein